MTLHKKEISSKPIVVFGRGNCFHRYFPLLKNSLNIVGVSDNAIQKSYLKDSMHFMPPDEIANYADTVLILIENSRFYSEVRSQVNEMGLKPLSLDEVKPLVTIPSEEQFIKEHFPDGMTDLPCEDRKIYKYVSITPPAYGCNLHCSYCYLSQTDSEHAGMDFSPLCHTPEFIRYCLSRKRLGGPALINFCGAGETMISDHLCEVCCELLKEGHYIHLVTNGLIGSANCKLIEMAGEYASHIFFKISMHYMQLRKKDLLNQFADNVNEIRKSPASFSVELMPHDELIPYIDEIKKYCLDNFGALPQLTVGRDDSELHELLSKFSLEQYHTIWGAFSSPLFEEKIRLYMLRGHGCKAGECGMLLDLNDGSISRCLFHENVGTLYDLKNPLDFPAVENSCPLNYCFNCHVYAALGVLPETMKQNYYDLRNRTTSDGENWIKEPIRKVFTQSVWNNCKERGKYEAGL